MPAFSPKRSLAAALAIGVGVLGIGLAEPRLQSAMIERKSSVTPPAPLLEYVTFGHQRGASAALWLQLLTWYGGALMKDKNALANDPANVLFLQRQTRLIIRMDPGFPDPYSFAPLTLTWYAGQPLAALPFLSAAMTQFPDVWEYPFYYAFIHHHFLDDPRTAAHFFLEAGKREGAPAFVPLLGTRLLAEDNRVEDAAEALRQLLLFELPEGIRDEIAHELALFEAVPLVEKAVAHFAEAHARFPSFDELEAGGYLTDVPTQTFSDKIVVHADGRVSVSAVRPKP